MKNTSFKANLLAACFAFFFIFSNAWAVAAESKDEDIPAGFENITNDYQGDVQLQVGVAVAGEADVDFADRKDQITLSDKAASLLEKAVDTKLTAAGKHQLLLVLTKPMKANAEIATPYLARSPHKIAAYFDVNALKFYLFIPPKYYSSQQLNYEYAREHPDSPLEYPANRLSYNVSRDISKTNQKNVANWSVNGVVASGRSSVHYQASISLSNYFNKLYSEYYGKRYQYRLGYQSPSFSTMLAPSGNYWGFLMQQNPRLINSQFYHSYKIPLTLVLDQVYYVQILQRGNILFSGDLPQGENVIKTTNFPLGTYPIVIKKRDLISGEETESTQVYSRGASIYNWMYSGFAMIAGIRSNALKPNNGRFDVEDGYFSIKNGMNVLKGDLNVSYTYADKRSYLGSRYDYLSENNFDYSLSTAVSEKGSLLGGLSMGYRKDRASLSASLRHSYISNDTSNKATNNASLNYSYSAKTWRVNATALYANNNSQLGAGMGKNFKWGPVPFGFNISVMHSDRTHFQALASLSLSLRTGNWRNALSTRQDLDDNKTALSLSTRWLSPGSKDAITNRIGMSIGSGKIQDNLSAKYNTQYQHFYANAAAVRDHHFKLTQALLGFKGKLIHSFEGFALMRASASSGYLVKLPAVDDDDAEYQINSKTYKPGQSVFVSGGSFQKSHFLVSSPSEAFQVKPDYYKAFLYPYNIHHIQLKLHRVCSVLFTLDPVPKGYWILQDMPDVFVVPGEETYAQIPQGAVLKLTELVGESAEVEAAVCNTQKIVQCNGSDEVDLGVLTCKEAIKLPPPSRQIIDNIVPDEPQTENDESKKSGEQQAGFEPLAESLEQQSPVKHKTQNRYVSKSSSTA